MLDRLPVEYTLRSCDPWGQVCISEQIICNPVQFSDISLCCFLCTFLYSSCVFYLYWNASGLYYRLLSLCAGPATTDVRSVFRRIRLGLRPTYDAHTHPVAAGYRRIAEGFLKDFASASRRRRFDISASPSALKSGAGNRIWCFAKDLSMPVVLDTPKVGDLITMVDVDYYVNLRQYLDGHHLALYTFTPRSAAGATDDGKYRVLDDGRVELHVNGGGVYCHELWDFNLDHLTVNHWWGSSTYLVERRAVSDDRTLVLFNHVRNVYGPLGWTFRDGLRRRQLRFGKKLVLHQTTDTVSFTSAGEFSSVTLPAEVVRSSLVRLKAGKEPHLSDVERVFHAAKVDKASVAAALFWEVWQDWPTHVEAVISGKVDQHTYQTLDPLVFEDGKSSLRAVAQAYLNGFAPSRSLNNDYDCVQSRILDVRNTKGCPDYAKGWMAEFVAQLRADVGDVSCIPYSYAEYMDKLKKPGQKQKIEQNQATLSLAAQASIKAFQKAEAYSKISNPRNISTLPVEHNFLAGQFMYPMMEILKRTKWYAPGRHPKKLVEALMVLVDGCTHLTSSDVHRMDGSVSEFLRLILKLVFGEFVPKEYQDVINQILENEINAKGRTTFGVYYEALGSILSGSSLTSLLGTLVNCYINWCAWRKLGKTAKEAYELLGMYFGDDGLTPDLPAAALADVAKDHGMTYESEEHLPHQPVKFLGRIYVDLWSDGVSIAQVDRQIRKIHLTATPAEVPMQAVLLRRAAALRLTDGNTPFLREWSDKVLQLAARTYGNKYETALSRDDSYWIQFETPFIAPRYELVHGIVAEDLGITAAELDRAIGLIKNATSFEELFFPLRTDEPVVKVAAVVAGEVRLPVNHIYKPLTDPPVRIISSVEEVKQQPPPVVPKMCRDFVAGKCTRAKCKFMHPPSPNSSPGAPVT